MPFLMKGIIMAAKGRPTTNPSTLARKQLIADMRVMSSQTSDAVVRARKALALMTGNPEAYASATGSQMLGNGLRATVRDAMVKAQHGHCFTCGTVLDRPGFRFTESTLFRLVPSIVGADEDVAGVDAMSAGTLPGNVVVVCATCSGDRNKASAAMGSPVAVTHDVMHGDPNGSDMLNACRILYVWPASPKGKTDTSEQDDKMSERRAARLGLLGW